MDVPKKSVVDKEVLEGMIKMNKPSNPCQIQMRPKIFLFSGLPAAQTFTVAPDVEVSKNAISNKLADELRTVDKSDIHIAYRLGNGPWGAPLDTGLAMSAGAEQGLCCAIGDWPWDCDPKEEQQFFASNTSRDTIVRSRCDLLVMEYKSDPFVPKTSRAYTSNILAVQKFLQLSIMAMYRCPKELQTNPVLGLTTDASLLTIRRKVADKLGCTPGNYEKTELWQAFLRLLTTALPFEEDLQIIDTLGGTSGCVVAMVGSPGKSPFVVKAGTPFSVGQELRGFLQVVLPKLQNHVSRPILFRPGLNGALFTQYAAKHSATTDASVSENDSGPTLGLTLLSVVGEPGNTGKPLSLKRLIRQAFENPAEYAVDLTTRLKVTLNGLIQVLHGNGQAHPCTIWQSYGSHLPPWFELDNSADGANEAIEYPEISYCEGGDERGNLIRDALELIKISDIESPSYVKFLRMGLFQLESSATKCKLEMIHPRLGIRLAVTTPAGDPSRVNYAEKLSRLAWVRRGHYVDATFHLKPRTCIEPYYKAATKAWRKEGVSAGFVSPLEFFAGVNPPANKDDRLRSPPKCPNAIAGATLQMMFPTAVGAIHGDLNLENLLFNGKNPLGWMIDFDRTTAQGPIALDYAKLQVEVLQHHGFEIIVTLAGMSARNPDEDPFDDAFALLEAIFQLLHFQPRGNLLHALRGRFADEGKNQCWVRLLHQPQKDDLYAAKLQLLLELLELIQVAAMNTLDEVHGQSAKAATSSVSANDLGMARAAYAFSAIKHTMSSKSPDVTKAAMLYRVSALSLNLSLGKLLSDDQDSLALLNNITTWTDGDESANARRMLLTQQLRAGPCKTLAELTSIAGMSELDTPVFLKDEGERCWDVASTGGIGNISPIMGFLLLMNRKASNKRVLVPKISSRGDGGGTTDTLEAGGYEFLNDPSEIRAKTLRDGGLFCTQTGKLVPADTVLMARRKEMGMMKSAELALASILGKKLPLGSQHIVLDVKLGADTKMLPRFPNVVPTINAAKRQEVAQQALLLHQTSTLPLSIKMSDVSALNEYLFELITGHENKRCGANERTWQHTSLGPGGTSFTQNVTILYSNGDMPQCRAVGRLPLLVQLELELGSPKEGNLPTDSQYTQFYFGDLAAACGWANTPAKARKSACKSWATLKAHLPLIPSTEELVPIKSVESEFALIYFVATGAPFGSTESLTLDFITVHFHDVPAWAQLCPAGTATLMTANVNPLDSLFKELSSEKNGFKADTGIGFWFHTLPHEKVQITDESEPKGKLEKAVFTAFFRKGVSKNKLRAKLINYLIRNLRWEFEPTVDVPTPTE